MSDVEPLPPSTTTGTERHQRGQHWSEYRKHLRPWRKRVFWKRTRMAARRIVLGWR